MTLCQGTPGLRGPQAAEEGQPIPVEVGVEGVDHLIVTTGQPGSQPQKFPVGPGGKAWIPPQPGWNAGTVLVIFTNTTPVKGIFVEIITPLE